MAPPLPDPFKLAEQAIKAFPEDTPWQEKIVASEKEFLEAAEQVLYNRAKPESLFARPFESQRMHITAGLDILAGGRGMFDERAKTVDLKILRDWHRKKKAIYTEVASFDGLPEHAKIALGNAIFPQAEPVNRLVYKFADTGYSVAKHQRRLVTLLADTAIEKALGKQPAKLYLQWKDSGEIEYRGVIPVSAPGNISNFKAQALVELQALKAQFASEFTELEKGYVLPVRELPKPALEKKAGGFMLLHAGPNTTRDFVPLIHAFLQFLEGDAAKTHVKHTLEGKRVANEAVDYAAALNQAERQLAKMHDHGADKEMAEMIFTSTGGILPRQIREQLGEQDFARLKQLADDLAQGNVAEFIEITSRKEVEWLKSSFGLGRGR